jgi:hypothetical protein
MRFARTGPLLTSIGCALLLGVLLVWPAGATNSSQDTATREFRKTVSLSAGQTFSIESKFGSIRIHGENSREADISATIRVQASSQAKAEKYAESIRIEVQEDGKGVSVRTVAPSDGPIVIRIGDKNSYSVDYDISVPVDAKLWVKNAFGDVEIRGARGFSEVESNHGRLTVRDGGPAKLTNAFGIVEASNMEGDLVVTSNNGTVTVSSIKGSVDLKDRFGTVTVRNVQGSATIVAGNGPVELTDAGNAKITNSFGAVEVRNIHGTLSVNNNNGAVEVNTVSGNAELSGSFGSITFSGVGGSVKCTANNGRVRGGPTGGEVYVRNTFGDVSLEQIGGAVQVENSNGAVSVREAKGKATLNTSFGAIEASGLRGGVRATTGNGRISLSDIGGEAYAKTSFGAVNIQRANGSLIIENSNGQVTANSVKGDATARTSFGAVTLDDVGGNVTVDNQNGAVMVSVGRTASVCKAIAVKTSFSPIQVRLPEGGGYNVTAHTSFGRITSELPVTSTGQLSGDSLNGKIGNGGCNLALTNSNGSIEILKLSR